VERGHGVGTQWMADGDVTLDGERRDRQDGRRRRHLRQERLEATVRLAEDPRVCSPDRVQLRRQTCNHNAATNVVSHTAILHYTVYTARGSNKPDDPYYIFS